VSSGLLVAASVPVPAPLPPLLPDGEPPLPPAASMFTVGTARDDVEQAMSATGQSTRKQGLSII
jgi:hypothetical protein